MLHMLVYDLVQVRVLREQLHRHDCQNELGYTGRRWNGHSAKNRHTRRDLESVEYLE